MKNEKINELADIIIVIKNGKLFTIKNEKNSKIYFYNNGSENELCGSTSYPIEEQSLDNE